MTQAASVEVRDRARLFCGLRLPEGAIDALSRWQAEHLRGGRLVARDHLHVTLAFLGHRPVDEVSAISGALREAVAQVRPISLVPERYRETRSVGMLVLSDDGGAASALADDLQTRLERLGVYERERRVWLPHLTVLRFKERPRIRPPIPATGPISPSDAAVYHSLLRSTGAQYVVVESFALGGAQ